MAGRETLRRRVSEAVVLLGTAADPRLEENAQSRLIESALGELADVAGGAHALEAAEQRLREAVSASSEPQLQRGTRARANNRARVPELANVGRRGGDISAEIEEKTLTAKQRKAMPKSDFAIPEKAPGPGSYPIGDEAHARNALSRVSQHGTAEEQARVRRAVKRRYPHIGGDDTSEVDDDVRHPDEEELSEQISNLGRKRARPFGSDRQEADVDRDEDEEDEDEGEGDEDEDEDETREQSLADRLARAGRTRSRRRESDVLTRVIGSTPLREVDGRSVDIVRAMHLDPDA